MTAGCLVVTLTSLIAACYLADAWLMAKACQRFAERHGVQALRRKLHQHQVFPGLFIWLEVRR